jgi:hypothetical protein
MMLLAAADIGRGAAESAISEGQRRFRRHGRARPSEGMIVEIVGEDGIRRIKIRKELLLQAIKRP